MLSQEKSAHISRIRRTRTYIGFQPRQCCTKPFSFLNRQSTVAAHRWLGITKSIFTPFEKYKYDKNAVSFTNCFCEWENYEFNRSAICVDKDEKKIYE